RYPFFKNGDQGVLNFVLNQKSRLDDLRVERRKIMRWPENSMKDVDAASVAARTAPALVVHWAGLKRERLKDMVGADLLSFFERCYYKKIPGGQVRRIAAIVTSAAAGHLRKAHAKTTNAIRRTTTK